MGKIAKALRKLGRNVKTALSKPKGRKPPVGVMMPMSGPPKGYDKPLGGKEGICKKGKTCPVPAKITPGQAALRPVAAAKPG